MNRKQIKADARKSLNRNFFRTILVVFIAGLIINGGYHYSTYIYDNTDILPDQYNVVRNTYDALKNTVTNIVFDGHEQRGVLAPLVNNIVDNRSITVGFISTINNLLFNKSLSNTIISIVSFTIMFIFFVFIQNVVKIGQIRYFLEQRRYKNTKADRLLFPYQTKRTTHFAYVLLMKKMYEILWSLTIIGGVIKIYEYKMIPYVLAENPNISKDEAFRLTKELTKGHKWELFKIDVSLIGWYILQVMTLGITSIFYFNAYKEAINAESYVALRELEYDKLTNKELLNDSYLYINEYKTGSYPREKFSIPVSQRRKILDIDYNKNYDAITYILLFFTLSFVGWIWEVLIGFIDTGMFINRGTMHGPWIPIYGYGCILTLCCLKKFRRHPVVFFIAAMLLCGTIEYGTAWYLETFKGMRWWDYEGYFLNINARVCFEGLLVFGMASSAMTYLFAPLLNNIFSKIPRKVSIVLCVVLLFFYGIDFAYTQFYPNKGNGVTTEVSLE